MCFVCSQGPALDPLAFLHAFEVIKVLLVLSRSDGSLCSRIGYRADRASGNPAVYKYTATSNIERIETKNLNVHPVS